MKKIVLTFGIISGLLSALMMSITMPLTLNGKIPHDKGLLIGYTAIVLAFLLVFFGIRTYRENAGGTITFGRAFKIGLLIVLISSAFYVATWQVLYFKFMPNFWDVMADRTAVSMRANGESEAKIAAATQQMREYKKVYDNPLLNIAFTLIEPLPVGIVVALISAAILRKKGPAPPAAATVLA
jgi:hypothetical protein